MELTKQTIEEIILSRRSIYPKDFKQGIKIDDDIIESILRLATWAPTHKLTQPWDFIVFKGAGVKEFFDKQAEIYQAITLPDQIAQRKIEKYAFNATQTSHVIAVIARHHPENKIPEIEETVATACALQNIYLSLNSFGIAGYLSTGNVCYSPQMGDYLGLNSGDKCLGFFQLGVPADEIKPVNRKRIDVLEKIEWRA